MKIIAIGGVAASMSAVSKLRRLNKDAEIIVYEKGEVLSYGACGMPYYISDEIKDPKRLIARTKEQFLKLGIVVHTNHEVIEVNDKEKTIKVLNIKANEIFTDSFDKLIIGTGASAIIPKWENVELENIHVLSVYEDSIAIKHKLDTENIKNVTVVGAGFIGVELVEAFTTRGLNVTLIELGEHILSSFDQDIAENLHQHLIDKGVSLKLNEKVIKFEGNNKIEKVITNKGEYLSDLVIISVGIIPNTKFLRNSNIALAKNGAIKVNDCMETNIKDIYAGGDCSLIYNRATKEYNYLPMGNNANKQGRVIAENINGSKFTFLGVLGTTVIKVIDMEAAKTGLTEKEAKRLHKNYKTVMISGRNHAGYYPNPEKITVKIVYEQGTYKILGASLVGRKDTALRINIFAVAIQSNMTTKELGFLDLAYAPPFAGVWDVVAVAANLAK